MLLKKDLLSDKVFQDGGFSGGLASDNSNLRQVDDHRHPELRKGILHPIDDRDECLHALIPRHDDDLLSLPTEIQVRIRTTKKELI